MKAAKIKRSTFLAGKSCESFLHRRGKCTEGSARQEETS